MFTYLVLDLTDTSEYINPKALARLHGTLLDLSIPHDVVDDIIDLVVDGFSGSVEIDLRPPVNSLLDKSIEELADLFFSVQPETEVNEPEPYLQAATATLGHFHGDPTDRAEIALKVLESGKINGLKALGDRLDNAAAQYLLHYLKVSG